MLQPLACPRVCLIEGAQQAAGGDVCVDLSCDQALVAEQFLDAADIRAGIKQMGGKAVAQGVWAGAA